MVEQVVETWQINHRVNMKLMDSVTEAGMQSTLSTRGGRDVARQFAHMHDQRFWWLEGHFRDLSKGLTKFASKQSPSKAEIRKAHMASTKAVEEMFRRVIEGGEPLKSWKRGVISALGYFIAHESHHRGSIVLTLKQTGNKLSQDIQYGIWDWSRI